MATQNVWYFREQLYRLIEESLEVALVICKAELCEFTVAKIFDIFSQIIPTAFVLNTGYWPFFNSIRKQSLCICGRYGLNCRHFKQACHWIDLDRVPADDTMTFYTRAGNLTLSDSHIEVTPITGSTAGYILNIKLTFQYKKIERGRPRRKKDESFNINPDQLVHVMISCRYILQREYYPALHSIMFQPSPFFYDSYGTYFPKLLKARQSLMHQKSEINPRFYTLATENMPNFTLMLQSVNLPIYQYTKTVINAVSTYLQMSKCKPSTRTKGTQTESEDSTEVWKYRELIGNLKPLWGDSQSSSSESLHVNYSDVKFGTYFVDDIKKQSTIRETSPNPVEFSVISSPIKKEIKDFDEEMPSSTTQDKEYDIQWPQWGYEKVVAKRRGRKKLYGMQLFGDNFSGSRKRPTENNRIAETWINSKCVSYSSIVKSSNQTQIDMEVCHTQSKNQEYSERDPDFQWIDEQFPDLLSSAVKKNENIDEQFDIAEEFIEQEKEREDFKLQNTP